MQWHWNFCIFVIKTQKYLILRVKHLEVRVSYTSTTNTNLPGPELVTQLSMKVVCCQKWMRWKMSKALLCKLLCGHCHARGHWGGRVQKVRKNWRRRWWMAPLKNNFPTHSGYTRHYTGGPADIGSQLLSLPSLLLSGTFNSARKKCKPLNSQSTQLPTKISWKPHKRSPNACFSFFYSICWHFFFSVAWLGFKDLIGW